MAETAPDTGSAAREDATTGVLIFGSCVSRDTFAFLPDSFRLLSYVARQSAISVGAPAAGVQERLTRLPSSFQDRVVRGDVRGDFLETVERLSPKVDLLLIDLIDERGGVVHVNGGYVTKLAELWNAGGAAATARGRRIAFATDDHFALWSAATHRIAERLRALDLFDRTLVLRTPWASTMPSGADVPVPSWMTRPDTANAQYVRYFAHLEALGHRIVSLPESQAQSTESHRWGPSPFHYTDEAYTFLAAEIRARAGRPASENA